MSRALVRTAQSWRQFDRWAWSIGVILSGLTLVVFWSTDGKCGPCCDEVTACTEVAPIVSTTVVSEPAPMPAPAPPPEPVPAPAPAPAPAPTPAPEAVAPVDCTTIMDGVQILFEVDDARLTDAGRQSLDTIPRCLTAKTYEVAGHTDADGTEAYNQKLSLRRAKAVVTYLISIGVPKQQMLAVGYGEKQPIVPNDTPQNKAKNRRITFRTQ